MAYFIVVFAFGTVLPIFQQFCDTNNRMNRQHKKTARTDVMIFSWRESDGERINPGPLQARYRYYRYLVLVSPRLFGPLRFVLRLHGVWWRWVYSDGALSVSGLDSASEHMI
jgi:hypothetical protein